MDLDRKPDDLVAQWVALLVHPASIPAEGRTSVSLCLCDESFLPSSPRLHCGDEAVEQVVAVLRAGGGLGVVLHREDRLAGYRQALERAVEQRDMGGLDAGRQRIRQHREAVVL